MSNPRHRPLSVEALKAPDGTTWLVGRRQARPVEHFGRRFVVTFTEDWAALLRAVRRPTALHLANELPLMLGTSDFTRLDQRVLAERYRTSQPVISRALSELVRVGAVERAGKGPGTKYRLSPRVAWRGTAGAYHAQQQRERRDYRAEARALALTAQLDLLDPPPPPDEERT